VRETGERRLPDAVGGGYCLASTDPIAPGKSKNLVTAVTGSWTFHP
jgi:hypothetical protein